MNELALCTDFLLDRLDSNPLINTITFIKTNDIDLNKENIYPVANVDIIESVIGDEVITINYIISILQQRDIDTNFNNDKIYNDNLIYNLNETNGIATRFINNIKRTVNDYDIEIGDISSLVMVKYSNSNLLDGVRFTLTLEIPNMTSC